MVIAQVFAYDAYGNAIGFSTGEALTEFLYSGEQFDSKIGQQYLRQRYYDPATGRFNRLDPFFGNLSDPQSLHNYLYCHADPVNFVDPRGQFIAPVLFVLGSMLIGYGIGGTWDTALFGGLLGVSAILSSPLALIGTLLVGMNLPWNSGRNGDYRIIYRELMAEKEFEYDHCLGFVYNYDTPSQALLQFRGGVGSYLPRVYYFGECPMTNAMRNQPKMLEIHRSISLMLFIKDILGDHTIPTLQKNNGLIDYLWYQVEPRRFFVDPFIFIGELGSSYIFDSRSDEWEAEVLASILGSYHYNYEIKEVDWNNKTAVVRFRAINAMGGNTATRVPFTGDMSILGDQNGGILADVTQFFLWEEEIKF
jgi:RHS repeat-associated protein